MLPLLAAPLLNPINQSINHSSKHCVCRVQAIRLLLVRSEAEHIYGQDYGHGHHQRNGSIRSDSNRPQPNGCRANGCRANGSIRAVAFRPAPIVRLHAHTGLSAARSLVRSAIYIIKRYLALSTHVGHVERLAIHTNDDHKEGSGRPRRARRIAGRPATSLWSWPLEKTGSRAGRLESTPEPALEAV